MGFEFALSCMCGLTGAGRCPVCLTIAVPRKSLPVWIEERSDEETPNRLKGAVLDEEGCAV